MYEWVAVVLWTHPWLYFLRTHLSRGYFSNFRYQASVTPPHKHNPHTNKHLALESECQELNSTSSFLLEST